MIVRVVGGRGRCGRTGCCRARGRYARQGDDQCIGRFRAAPEHAAGEIPRVCSPAPPTA